MSYAEHLRTLLAREIEAVIARVLPWLIRRSLATKLHAVYLAQPARLPPGGVVLVANHHSWWDGYLVWFLLQRLGRKLTVMMDREQLKRFRFFRHLGAIAHTEVRLALRRLAGGEVVLIFPEAALRPAGWVENLQPGAVFLAERAKTPIVPLAIRVLMRGAEHPEALLSLGEPLPGDGEREVLKESLGHALNTLLADLEARAKGDPEQPPSGCDRLLGGAQSTHNKMAWVERLWTR
ncbi:MAG: lysophospholipid acyltransferase family protein [Truepera sp.]|nr:lysophospholipid acyltransferase family protein [Truepera sp.]